MKENNQYSENKLQYLGLNLLDRVIRPKIGNPLVMYHAIYMGVQNNKDHIFIENNDQLGVRLLTLNELFPSGLRDYRIIRFDGNQDYLQTQYKLALSLIGSKYDLLKFNCENLANLIQKNWSISLQVKKVMKIALYVSLTIFLIYLIMKSKKTN